MPLARDHVGQFALLKPPVNDTSNRATVLGACNGFELVPEMVIAHAEVTSRDALETLCLVEVLGTGGDLMEAMEAEIPFRKLVLNEVALQDELKALRKQANEVERVREALDRLGLLDAGADLVKALAALRASVLATDETATIVETITALLDQAGIDQPEGLLAAVSSLIQRATKLDSALCDATAIIESQDELRKNLKARLVRMGVIGEDGDVNEGLTAAFRLASVQQKQLEKQAAEDAKRKAAEEEERKEREKRQAHVADKAESRLAHEQQHQAMEANDKRLREEAAQEARKADDEAAAAAAAAASKGGGSTPAAHAKGSRGKRGR